MNVFSRAKALGATSALALAGPAAFSNFLLAAQKVDAGDVKLINTAIALERAGIKAYTDAAATNLLSPPVLTVLKGFMADHAAHRDALIAAVQQAGATPTEETTTLVYPTLATETDIVTFAYGIERQAANTYLTVVPTFKSAAFAQTAASILGVETTHVALLGQALKRNPVYPSGFVTA